MKYTKCLYIGTQWVSHTIQLSISNRKAQACFVFHCLADFSKIQNGIFVITGIFCDLRVEFERLLRIFENFSQQFQENIFLRLVRFHLSCIFHNDFRVLEVDNFKTKKNWMVYKNSIKSNRIGHPLVCICTIDVSRTFSRAKAKHVLSTKFLQYSLL